MTRSVFMVSTDNSLTELKRSDFDTEDLLQALLADHPRILNMAAGADGKLLLVSREAAVPEEANGYGRWSLDHLFLDAEAVPVLVETKRSSDTRLRREVVAQMLDYAANGVAYWPIEQIIEAYEATAVSLNLDPERELQAFLGEQDAEAFWRQTDANLRSGRVRMVFVADVIPPELQRIVEFLNEQMRPAEVLAIEVQQFTTDAGLRLLAPRVVGQTERAATTKAVQSSRVPVTEEEFLSKVRSDKGEATHALVVRLIQLFRDHGFVMGSKQATVNLPATFVDADGEIRYPFFFSLQDVWANLYHLQGARAFSTSEARLELLGRLKALPGVRITTNNANGRPGVPYSDMARPEVWSAFENVIRFVKDRLAAT